MKSNPNSIVVTDFTQTELVTLAVYLLGGNRRAIDTEDIAMKLYEIAPTRFAWKKYPEQVNLELVRVYLSDAKKTQKGSLLTGSGRTGWMLSEGGMLWAKGAEKRMPKGRLSRDRAQTKSGSIDEVRWRRERARVMSTAAWTAWSEGSENVSLAQACEVFRIDSYVTPRLRENKIMRLSDMFDEDKNLRTFVSKMALLVRNGEGNRNG